MSDSDEDIILRAYGEARLAAFEKGLSGLRAHQAVLNAAAKVSTKLLGRPISPEEVETIARLSQ